MPKIGYSANGFGKAMEASVEVVDAMDAVEANGDGGRIDGDSSSFLLRST